MENQTPLQFVKALLNAMCIPNHQVSDLENGIPSEIDAGLRSLIYGEENYYSFLHNSLKEANDQTIYRFQDEYFCNYIFFRLPDLSQYFFIGPYLLSIPSFEMISAKFSALGKKEEELNQFHEYYGSLTSLDDDNILLTIVNTLGCSLWGSIDQFSNEYIDYLIPDRITPITSAKTNYQTETMHYKILEELYAAEKELMDAVSQGKIHKVNRISESFFNSKMRPRLDDTLRNRKNYMIILNTLLRKAAEYGSVHPVHLDRISSSYAHEIEEIKTIDASMNMMIDMIRNYCLLVKNHSLNQYSMLVGQVITMVSFDLKSNLTLNNLANILNVSSSYLSRIFTKEMKMTLTEYVNRKRIEYAVTLLDSTDFQIQSIAFECGIQDVNYFIKLFKKQTGLTPSQYRNQFVHNISYKQ